MSCIERISNSPTVRLTAGAAGLASGIALVQIVALAIIGHTLYNYHKLVFEVSLMYNKFWQWISPEKYGWFDQINDSVYLGAMPMENMGHKEQLKALGITKIISLNEPWELKCVTLIGKPVKWEEIEFINLPTKDFHGLSPEIFERVRQEIFSGKVYIHCKAGVGRSVIATMYALGLSKNEIQAKRAMANPSDRQIRSIPTFAA